MNLINPLLNINKFIKTFTIDSPAKILSLVMAIFLFMFHNINLLKTKTISSELEIEGEQLIITNVIPESVSVKLRGGENDIANISGSDIITFIDLSSYTVKGSYHVPVKIIKSGSLLNMDTLEVSVEPVDILVNLDSMVIKNLKISPNISGTLAAGYDFASSSVEPDQIQVEGPASLIDTISEIITEPINISGRYSDFSLLSNLANPGRFFTLRGNPVVEYSAKIRESSVQQLFPGININAVNLNENFSAKILPETGSITLRGSYTGINAFVPNGEMLVVDCSTITTEGSFDLPVKTGSIDSGATVSADSAGSIEPIEIYSYQPEKVTVEITKRETND
jgi:YbbR domain-containing protein